MGNKLHDLIFLHISLPFNFSRVIPFSICFLILRIIFLLEIRWGVVAASGGLGLVCDTLGIAVIIEDNMLITATEVNFNVGVRMIREVG